MRPQPILRYKGSKWKNRNRILACAPQCYHTFVDVFLGGGSILLSVPPDKKRICNDANPDVIRFWRAIRGDHDLNAPQDIIERVQQFRDAYMPEGEHEPEIQAEFEQAKSDLVFGNDPFAFLILNRYSHQHFVRRFRSNIASFEYCYADSGMKAVTPQKLQTAREVLREVELYNLHFRELIKSIEALNETAFVFLDPPYWIGNHGSPLYEFDLSWQEHEELAEWMKTTRHHVLMTNGDNCGTAQLYFGHDFQTPHRKEKGFFRAPLKYRYSTKLKDQTRQTKKEWIITNYDPSSRDGNVFSTNRSQELGKAA